MPYRAFRSELRIGYFVPFIIMTALTAAILRRVNAQVAATRWVEHTYKVMRVTREAETEIFKIEFAFNSYWTSADKRYLVALDQAEADLNSRLSEVSVLISDNADQELRLLKLSSLEGEWLATIRNLLVQKNAGSASPTSTIQADDKIQTISRVFDDLVGEEDRLLQKRAAGLSGADRVIFLAVPLLGLVGASLLSYLGWIEINKASREFAAALRSAEEANRSKDIFLATVSHELRNPLNSIMLTASVLLSDQSVSSNIRKRVETISRAARSQAQLIEDLLDISRLESGRLRLDVQATDLVQVVNNAVDSMRPAAEAKAIKLQAIVDSGVNLIPADSRRLEQVVWNLVSNSIKFTPKDGSVQVRLERINSHVEVIVADNGKGIDPASLPFVFDRFWQQADPENKRGIGLGLSIVKELVALHGGTIVAHSEGLGKGSTFTVRLPLPPVSMPLLEARRHPTVSQAGNFATIPRLDGLAILVVDDESEVCEALTSLLGSLGAKVSAENTVRDALEWLTQNFPDVVIADIEMPVNDGLFFAREVRKGELSRHSEGHLPLIALTAYGRVEDKVKILASGFDSHIIKPVDLAELSATIRSLVAAGITSAAG